MAHKHTYKTKIGLVTKNLTSTKAIRAKCLDCCCWNEAEVKRCEISDCALFPFRMGKTGITRKKKVDSGL
jgi:hypothetical protein